LKDLGGYSDIIKSLEDTKDDDAEDVNIDKVQI